MAGILQRLGWGHHGFHVVSARDALLGLLILLAIPFVYNTVRLQLFLKAQPSDLQFWCRLANEVSAEPDRPIYQREPRYLYPPFYLMLMRPLAALPARLTVVFFELLKWAALVLSLRIAWRLCSPRDEDLPPVVTLGSMLLTWRFIWSDISGVNVNLFILLAILAACYFLVRSAPISAGLVLGAAIAIKVTPALLIVYFLYKRWWRAGLSAAAGTALCVFILPALWLGWDNNCRAVSEWYQHVILGFVQNGLGSGHLNQSLTGVINRLFGDSLAIEPDIRVTLVFLPASQRQLLRLVVGGGTLLALAVLCRRRFSPGREPHLLAAEVGLVSVAMLLLSGYSWKPHFVVLLPAYTLLLAYLADARNARAAEQQGLARSRRLVGWVTVASFALASLTSFVLGPVGANYAEAYGLIMLGGVLGGLAVAIVRSQAPKLNACMARDDRRPAHRVAGY